MTFKDILNQTRHVIWDWNGTLINDPHCCVNILNVMLEKRNIPQLGVDDYRKMFDFPLKKFYSELGVDFTKESFDDIANEFIDHYENDKLNCSLHKDSLSLLKWFQNQQFGQSIYSAYHHDLLHASLKHFEIEHFFSSICGTDNLHAKGKQQLIESFLQATDFEPHEILMIGDTVNDFEISRNFGVHCVLMSHGHHHKEKLSPLHPFIFDNFEQFLTETDMFVRKTPIHPSI